jgi:hypothetical protein
MSEVDMSVAEEEIPVDDSEASEAEGGRTGRETR